EPDSATLSVLTSAQEPNTTRAAVASSPLPTGTLTFVMSDALDSTRLWERYPDGMRQSTVRHDTLIQRRVEEHAGVPVRPRGEGASRFAVFTDASNAVAAAVAIADGTSLASRSTLRSTNMDLSGNTSDAVGIVCQAGGASSITVLRRPRTGQRTLPPPCTGTRPDRRSWQQASALCGSRFLATSKAGFRLGGIAHFDIRCGPPVRACW